MTTTTETPSRVAQAEAYVRSRFYPPLPYEYGQYAVDAVDACNEGEPDRLLVLDGDLPLWPRGAEENADGDMEIRADALVDALRLGHLIDADGFDMS